MMAEQVSARKTTFLKQAESNKGSLQKQRKVTKSSPSRVGKFILFTENHKN